MDESVISPVSKLLSAGSNRRKLQTLFFEAIKEGIFYILPHPAWDKNVEGPL